MHVSDLHELDQIHRVEQKKDRPQDAKQNNMYYAYWFGY